MMGLILIGVGLAVPDLPTAIAVALVFGTAVNPFLFVPLAFDPEVEKRLWYGSLAVVSFLGVSGGLVAAAVVGPAEHLSRPPCPALRRADGLATLVDLLSFTVAMIGAGVDTVMEERMNKVAVTAWPMTLSE